MASHRLTNRRTDDNSFGALALDYTAEGDWRELRDRGINEEERKESGKDIF